MRLALVAAGIMVAIMSALSQQAGAQGKDPFRPPGGGADPGRISDPVPRGPADLPAAPATVDDGLPRTGQDVAMQLWLGLGLVAIGGALRIVHRAAQPRCGGPSLPPGLGTA